MGLEYVEITDACTTLCPAGTAITLIISNLKNRASVKEFTNSFTIRTYTKELYKIDKGEITNAIGLTLIPAPFTSIVLVSPSTPIYTGVPNTYTFNIVSENGIAVSNTGTLAITLPNDVAFLNQSPIC